MATEASIEMLERRVDSVTRDLPPDAARRLAELRAEPDAERRIEELADKCSEGLLTDDERSEYEMLVHIGTVIGLFQMKARELLAKTTAA